MSSKCTRPACVRDALDRWAFCSIDCAVVHTRDVEDQKRAEEDRKAAEALRTDNGRLCSYCLHPPDSAACQKGHP